MFSVEAALAVDAVKSTDFSVGRHEVDAQRNAESATVNRTENGRRIDDANHVERSES